MREMINVSDISLRPLGKINKVSIFALLIEVTYFFDGAFLFVLLVFDLIFKTAFQLKYFRLILGDFLLLFISLY
jgi:hypothetical protein